MKLPKPVGMQELTDVQILAALEIPTWDKWSLANEDPPERISNVEVKTRHSAGHIRKGYIHLKRIVLKVRDDLWYESTTNEYNDARARWEKRKRDEGTAVARGAGRRR